MTRWRTVGRVAATVLVGLVVPGAAAAVTAALGIQLLGRRRRTARPTSNHPSS